MSWDCLSAEIAVMFSDFTTREHDVQMSMEYLAAVTRSHRAAYMRDYDKNRRRKDEAYLAARRKTAREAMRRLYARRLAEQGKTARPRRGRPRKEAA